MNASADYVRFYAVPAGIESLDKDKLFAKYWTNSQDENERRAHKRLKCAEVLVPEKVQPNYILGAYVANEKALANFTELGTELTVCVRNDIFF